MIKLLVGRCLAPPQHHAGQDNRRPDPEKHHVTQSKSHEYAANSGKQATNAITSDAYQRGDGTYYFFVIP
jgi:hypothetical protein